MEKQQIMLECKGMYKSFGKNMVLQDINIKINKGEVHAFLGQNGAGKSTLVKIITGVYAKDEGAVFMDGREIPLNSPRDAETNGIAIIHQDQQMVPYFDVTRNAFLGTELKKKSGLLDWNRMRNMVAEQLKFIRADFTADRQISSLSVGQREQAAIVSALLKKPRLLILDEPTASLSSKEIEQLFEVINILKKEGVTVIYISHHMDEIFAITDSLTVLRDSKVQGTFATKMIDRNDIVTLMIGRELKDFYPKEEADIGEVVLEVDDLYSGKAVRGASFQLRKGEILGLAGLVGAGRTETVLAMYGAEKLKSGRIKINGQEFKPKSPLASVKKGVAFIPEDRRNEGVVMGMSIAENLSLATTGLFAKHNIINRGMEQIHSSSVIDKLKVVCMGCRQEIAELSGGNQQKIVIGRWLIGEFDIFVFDQPTTGVDVGAKTEIYKQIIKLARKGCGIILISSENEELLGICDRIAIMVKGQIVKEFKAKEATEHDLLYWSAGGDNQGKRMEMG